MYKLPPQPIVPLTEIGEYTDAITIEPNLPVSIDESQIGVNIVALEKIRRLGYLGNVLVQGKSEKLADTDISVGGIGSGIATAATSKPRKISMFDTELRQPSISFNMEDLLDSLEKADTEYRTVITVNNSEVEESIRADGRKWNRGVFDVAARSHYLDRTMRRGLAVATRKSLLSPGRVAFDAAFFGAATLYYDPHQGVEQAMVHATKPVLFMGLFGTVMRSAINGSFRPSLFHAANFDRYAVNRTRLAVGKLVVPMPESQ